MIREVIHDLLFLSGKSEKAVREDSQHRLSNMKSTVVKEF